MTESTKDDLDKSILRILTENADKDNGWVLVPKIAIKLGLSLSNAQDVTRLDERLEFLKKQGDIEVSQHLGSQPFQFSGARITPKNRNTA